MNGQTDSPSQLPIHVIDTYFQGMTSVTAVYLLQAPDGPVLIETGPGSTLPVVIDALSERGLTPGDIKHILVTHIHLDHAGAAGWWAQQGAQIYVHPVGAPHLVDPSKLLGSAGRIYGEMMDQLWGEVLPAPAERVTAIETDIPLTIAGLTITPLSTPGHAWHHHVYRLGDGDTAVGFTGDALGIHLPHVGLADLPAPPPEFHLETWQATLDRIAAEQFSTIYPTHFGRMDDPARQLAELRTLLPESVAFVDERQRAGLPREAIVSDYLDWNHARMRAAGADETAVRQMSLANPLFMSVDGILRYLKKRDA